MKVAIVHYWLVNMRGGEKVIEALCELYPQADIFTHVLDPAAVSDNIKQHKITTSFIHKLPKAGKLYQKYLPLMPMALEQLDLTGYDLVISSESGPAKGVITSPESLHICYCHTPMRYVWDMYHEYRRHQGLVTKALMGPLIHYLKIWDLASAARVDHFVANSNYVAKRIGKYYRRVAEVIHPPVDTQAFNTSDQTDDYYLLVGQLVNYKRADLAVEAFNRMGKKLVVIGEGEQYKSLEKIAKGNITLLGRQPFDIIKDYYARCKALIFPGEEDFGMVPVEAMASGRPVIAYKKGGAMETVVDGKSGLFFEAQTVDSLIQAVERFEKMQEQFDSSEIVDRARSFDKARFKEQFVATVDRLMADREKRCGQPI